MNKNAGGTTIATDAYDANGNRIADTTAGQDRYYDAAGQEIEDRNSSGTVTNQNVWAADGNVQDLVLRDDNSTSGNLGKTSSGLGQRLYVQQDANHNVTALTDASGNVKERFIYDPYGSVTVLSSSWATTTDAYSWLYLFQGGRYDPATGLHHFGARDYSPTLGRWIAMDPSGYPDGLNAYQMEVSDPVAHSDVTGRAAAKTTITHGPLVPRNQPPPDKGLIQAELDALQAAIEPLIAEASALRQQLIREMINPSNGLAGVNALKKQVADLDAQLAQLQKLQKILRSQLPTASPPSPAPTPPPVHRPNPPAEPPWMMPVTDPRWGIA